VREYSSWQQLNDEASKTEVRKACDVALDNGLELTQINEDSNYFKARGIKWGIVRRFIRDISLTPASKHIRWMFSV
jgi:hypothetical protein